MERRDGMRGDCEEPAGRASSLYNETLLDRCRNPRRRGAPRGATCRGEGKGNVCGDRVEIFLRVGAGNRIEDAGFEARACAVCVAAASLICDAAVGKTASEAAALAEKLAALLSGGGAASEAAAHGGWDSIPGDLRALEALKDFPARAGCAALAAAALRAALAGGGPGTAQGESADRGAGAVG